MSGILNKISILAVDDEAITLEWLGVVLHRKVGSVTLADSGTKALELFDPDAHDIVITDITMPKMDGIALASKLKERSPHTPIVVMTAFSTEEVLLQAIDLGVEGFVKKPVVPKKLFEKLEFLSFKLIEWKALQREINYRDKLIRLMPLPIYVKDHALNYVDCNEAFLRLINTTKEEVIGKNVHDFLRSEEALFHHNKDLELYNLKEQRYKYHFYTLEGETKVFEFYKSVLTYNGEFDGYIGIIIDITDQEIYEKNLEKRVKTEVERNIEQQQEFMEKEVANIKFASIGQLAAGITHEINTPLTYLKGNLELMRFDLDEMTSCQTKERMLEEFDKMSDGINRIAYIVDSMREMSQKSSALRTDANVYTTLVTSLTVAHNRAKHIARILLNGREFQLGQDKEAEKFICQINKQRIEQVWVIIINNALDELVKIEEYEDRHFEILTEQRGGYLHIFFKDNAGGISGAIIEKVFEPFISTKEEKGMGVGLSIAKRIVTEQEGTIRAYNEKLGAVFEVVLPLSQKQEG